MDGWPCSGRMRGSVGTGSFPVETMEGVEVGSGSPSSAPGFWPHEGTVLVAPQGLSRGQPAPSCPGCAHAEAGEPCGVQGACADVSFLLLADGKGCHAPLLPSSPAPLLPYSLSFPSSLWQGRVGPAKDLQGSPLSSRSTSAPPRVFLKDVSSIFL